MKRQLRSRVRDALLSPLLEALERRLVDRMVPRLMQQLGDRPWKRNLFVPSIDLYQTAADGPFMEYGTCSARDFFHPEFKRLFRMLGIDAFFFHRKYWEWIYILHHISGEGVSGKRGLGFGVGSTEPLAAAFAMLGASVTATDAPSEIGIGSGWSRSGEHASVLEALPYEGIIDKETFRRHVEFDVCDMTSIPARFTDYDFCWSSCCFEHLGDLRKGLDFVIDSVEKTLKVGGLAVHTTEFNLSSTERTVESGPTVLYRKPDIDGLIGELRARGHHVVDFKVAPDSLVIDGYVDTPPYGPPAHLKLDLFGFTCTSAGLIVRRGR